MPAARQASRSSAKALAVSAMIGVRGRRPVGLGGADAARRLDAVDAPASARPSARGRTACPRRARAPHAASASAPFGTTVGRWPSLASSARASSALISLSSATRIDSAWRRVTSRSTSRGTSAGALARLRRGCAVKRARERGGADRLHQVIGEPGRLQRRQLGALLRRDQHDAARHRCACRRAQRLARVGPSARSTSSASKRRSASSACAVSASARGADLGAPAGEPLRRAAAPRTRDAATTRTASRLRFGRREARRVRLGARRAAP